MSTNHPRPNASPPLEISVRTLDGARLVKLSGPLRLGLPVDKLDATLVELVDLRERLIVLDLEEVPSIDSSGIGSLVRALTATRQNGIALKVVRPGKFVLQTLKLVKLLPLFEVYDDVSQALASFEH